MFRRRFQARLIFVLHVATEEGGQKWGAAPLLPSGEVPACCKQWNFLTYASLLVATRAAASSQLVVPI